MAAAVFYAGAGSALSHVTAGWWCGMLKAQPTARARQRSRPTQVLRRVRVHCRRRPGACWHKRLPLTPPAQTLLDIAGVVRFMELRRALAEAEYRRLVTLAEVDAVLGRGRRGSAALRVALECHLPPAGPHQEPDGGGVRAALRAQLADPTGVNVKVAGWTVDAVWFDQRLAVELDSHAAHGTPAAMEEDRRRDLELRAAGYTVLRYTWRQLTDEWDLVNRRPA